MADKEIYRLELNVGVTGDGATIKKLSAMDRFVESSEKRIKQLDRLEASPAVELQDKISSPLKKMEGRIGSFAKSAVKKLSLVAGAGAALVGGFGLTSTLKTFTDYEQGLANVRAVTNATAEEMKILSDEARRLGRDTAWSAVQVTEAEQLLAQAGFSVQETVGALPGLLNLASAGGLDLANATDIAAGTLRAFGMEAEQAGHVADVLAVASSATNSDVMGLGESMKYVGPAAKALGVDVEQTTAVLGMLANANIKGSQAGTTLRSALTRLAKPTKQSSDMMKQLGFNAFDSAGKILPMHELIGNLQKSTSNLTEQQRANAMATIFGQEAMSGMLALVEQGPDALKELTQSLYDSEGAAQKMADTRLDSISGQMELLKSAADDLKLTLGEKLAPYTRNLVEWTTKNIPLITDKIVELVDKAKSFATQAYPSVLKFIDILKEVAPYAIGIGAAFATLKIASTAGGAITAFTKLKGVLSTGAFAFKAVAGGAATLGEGMALLMGPVGWVALAVGALVTGFIVAYKKSETFRNKVHELKDSFLEFIRPIIDTAIPVLQNIGNAFMDFANAVIPFVMSGLELLMGVFTVLWENVLQPLATYILGVYSESFQTAFTIIGSIVTNVIETITGILSGFKQILSGISDFIVGIFTGNWEQAFEGIKSITSGTIEVVKSIFTGLVDFVKEIPGQMLAIGKNIMQGLADGIKTAISIPVNAVKNVGKSIADGVKGVLKIKSPSRVMMEYGEFTTEGLALGMEDKIPRLQAVVGTTYDVIAREDDKVNKVNMGGFTERIISKVREINPFNYDPDPNSQGKPKPRPVAVAGGGGGSNIYQFNIGKPEFDFSGLGSDIDPEEVEQMVDEGLEKFGKSLLQAIKDKK